MGKLYVVEGPDASGKTSTAKELSKRVNAINPFPNNFWKLPKGASPQEYYTNRFREAASIIESNLPKGNIVLASYVFRHSAMHYAYLEERVPIMDDVAPPDLILFLMPSIQELQRRLNFRREQGKHQGEHETNPEMYARLIQRYEELLGEHPKVIKIDNTGRTVEEVVDDLFENGIIRL